jgi:hypothetical protein
MLRGRISGLFIAWTMDSSSAALQTIKTMKPRLSISKDKDLVKGRVGEPAITTTSVRPPFLALLARLVFLMERLS